MTRAVLYARVSGDDRNKTGDANLTDQLDPCRKHAEEHGYEVVGELEEDDRGASGATFDLPKLSEALDMARAGRYDVLVVHELDRLSRGLAKQLIVELELNRADVTIEYVLYDFSDTAEGRLNKNLRPMLAEHERERIRERMIQGRRRRAKAGQVVLHGRTPDGYRKVERDGETFLEIDEEQVAVVRCVFRWYTEGDGDGGPLGTPRIAGWLTADPVPTWADLNSAD